MQEEDGAEPECETEAGCRVPPPGEWGWRAIKLREELVLIGPLVGPEAVLRRHRPSSVTMDLLKAIEEELARQAEEEQNNK